MEGGKGYGWLVGQRSRSGARWGPHWLHRPVEACTVQALGWLPASSPAGVAREWGRRAARRACAGPHKTSSEQRTRAASSEQPATSNPVSPKTTMTTETVATLLLDGAHTSPFHPPPTTTCRSDHGVERSACSRRLSRNACCSALGAALQ